MKEVWTGISGTSTDNIDLNATPSLTTTQENLDGPVNIADNYGVRLRGYITAPVTGEYTFWLASNDNGKLWLSTDEDPANKGEPIASVSDWTDHLQWNKFESQQSDPVSLTAGTRYYIEILHKEGTSGDNCTVGWAKPGQSTSAPSEVVPTSVLSPFVPAIIPAAPTNLAAIPASAQRIDLSWTDAASNELGYIVDMAEGSGEFSQVILLGANQTSWQATGLSPETEYRFRVYAYNLTGNSSYSPVATATTHALAVGSVTQEVWEGITGWGTEDIPINDPPASVNELTSLESYFQSKDYYGQRIRGYIIPPVTGNYTFFIASDDCSKLWLSTNDQAAARQLIASVSGYTNSREWYKFPSQTSSPVALTAGVRYYVEILHKEGGAGDNCAVAWLKPGESGPPNVITAEYLSPFMLPVPPSAAPSGLAATPISATPIDLSWTDNTSNEDRFIIERALAGSGSFVQVGTSAENSTIFHDAGLQANTQYDYRIKAENDYGNSDYSNIATAITLDNTSEAPPSTELFAFAVYSSEITNLRDRCVFDGGGAVGSNTEVEVAAEATVNGNVLSGGTVALRSQATINGDVMAAEGVTIDAGAVVNGTVNENATVATVDIPEKEDIPTGTEDVDVALDEVRPMLAPGYYKEFIVRARGKITLGAGRYTFEKFFLEPDAIIELDIETSDMVEIDVVGDVEFSDHSKMVFKEDGYVPFVRLYTNDANMVRIGCQVELNGVLTAPHGDIHMYSGAQCNGALYGKTITVEPDAVILSGMVNPENDNDGDGLPNYLEVVLGTDMDDSLSYVPIAIPSRSWLNNDIQDECVTYDYSRYFPEYPADKKKKACYPQGSLCNPHLPLIFTVENDPSNSGTFSKPGYRRLGRFISQLPVNCITTGNSAIVTFPRPPSFKPGIEIKVVQDTGSGGEWDPVVQPSPLPPDDGEEGVPVEPPGIPVEIHPSPPGGGGGGSFTTVQQEKLTTTTLYFDNAIVYTEKQELSLDYNLTISDYLWLNVKMLKMRVYYTLVGGGSQPPVDIELFSEDIEGVPVYSVTGRIPFNAPVVINACELLSVGFDDAETSISTQSFNGNFVLNYGMVGMLKMNTTTRHIFYMPVGYDHIAWYFSNAVEFESAGFGDGRIINGSDGSPFEYEYYLKDHLGSTRMVLNEAGDPVEATMYQPYGTMVGIPTTETSALNVREKFTTKEFDEEGGTGGGDGLHLFYFGARYYDPEIGTWTSVDPMRQYLNSYLYCSNNPVLIVDSDGNWSFKHFFSTFAAEFIRPFVEMGRAISEHNGRKFWENAFFGLSITGAMLNMTEASGAATYSILPDVENYAYGPKGKHTHFGHFLQKLIDDDAAQWSAHGGGSQAEYEDYIKTEQQNAKENNPFKRWKAKGRIAHTAQDRKHHSNSSRIKGPWNMILSPDAFQNFEDVWMPITPDIPFMNELRIWEGASDYYDAMYGKDLGL
jgi:RHS repeat-associated protein